MNSVGPIIRFASATLLTILLGASAGAYSDEAVSDAEELLKQVKDRFERGEITRTDVAQAEYHVLEMKYRAGLIAKRTYCRQAPPFLEARGSGTLEESRFGQRSTQDVIEFKREYFKVKQLCEQPAPRPKRWSAPAHFFADQ